MPKRLIFLSRSEPARTIVMLLGFLSGTAQLIVLSAYPEFSILINTIIVCGVSAWAIWAAIRNNVKQMSLSSFWLFMIWTWTGSGILATTPDPLAFEWFPFLMVSVCLGICYIFLNGMAREVKRVGGGRRVRSPQ